jgi:hypothetical protein
LVVSDSTMYRLLIYWFLTGTALNSTFYRTLHRVRQNSSVELMTLRLKCELIILGTEFWTYYGKSLRFLTNITLSSSEPPICQQSADLT